MSMSPEIIEERRLGIAATDAAPILGLSPWKSPADVWIEKRHPELTADKKDNPSLIWGSKLEPLIAEEYSRRSGQKIERLSLVRNKKIPWLMCQPDFILTGRKKGLECKTASSHASFEWGPSGSDLIPSHYLIQIAHQMMVLDWPEWDLAALIGGSDFRVYHIFADRGLMKDIFETEKEFYTRFIIGDEQPAFDWGNNVAQLVKKKYPKHKKGEEFNVDQNGDKMLREALTRLSEIKRNLKALEKDEEAKKYVIQAYMKDAEVLTWLEGQARATWRNIKDSISIDWEKIVEEILPHVSLDSSKKQEIIKKYTEDKPGYRRFVFKDKNSGEE